MDNDNLIYITESTAKGVIRRNGSRADFKRYLYCTGIIHQDEDKIYTSFVIRKVIESALMESDLGELTCRTYYIYGHGVKSYHGNQRCVIRFPIGVEIEFVASALPSHDNDNLAISITNMSEKS